MKTKFLREEDLEETFSRASGPGGQNVNKVATKVTLRHRPTNISVTVQDARSQAANRASARERLLAALQQREEQAQRAARAAREKQRRQTSPRPPRLKARLREEKRHRAAVKAKRGRVTDD